MAAASLIPQLENITDATLLQEWINNSLKVINIELFKYNGADPLALFLEQIAMFTERCKKMSLAKSAKKVPPSAPIRLIPATITFLRNHLENITLIHQIYESQSKERIDTLERTYLTLPYVLTKLEILLNVATVIVDNFSKLPQTEQTLLSPDITAISYGEQLQKLQFEFLCQQAQTSYNQAIFLILWRKVISNPQNRINIIEESKEIEEKRKKDIAVKFQGLIPNIKTAFLKSYIWYKKIFQSLIKINDPAAIALQQQIARFTLSSYYGFAEYSLRELVEAPLTASEATLQLKRAELQKELTKNFQVLQGLLQNKGIQLTPLSIENIILTKAHLEVVVTAATTEEEIAVFSLQRKVESILKRDISDDLIADANATIKAANSLKKTLSKQRQDYLTSKIDIECLAVIKARLTFWQQQLKQCKQANKALEALLAEEAVSSTPMAQNKINDEYEDKSTAEKEEMKESIEPIVFSQTFGVKTLLEQQYDSANSKAQAGLYYDATLIYEDIVKNNINDNAAMAVEIVAKSLLEIANLNRLFGEQAINFKNYKTATFHFLTADDNLTLAQQKLASLKDNHNYQLISDWLINYQDIISTDLHKARQEASKQSQELAVLRQQDWWTKNPARAERGHNALKTELAKACSEFLEATHNMAIKYKLPTHNNQPSL